MRGDKVDILLNGTSRLDNHDKEEVFSNVEKILRERSNLHLFVKSNFEVEILRFILQYMKNVDTTVVYNLFIYTLQPMEELPIKRQTPIKFLCENGANFYSFNHTFNPNKLNTIDRKVLTSYWTEIIRNMDMVIVFFDGEEFQQLIPLDVADTLKVDAAKARLLREGKKGHTGSQRERTEFFKHQIS